MRTIKPTPFLEKVYSSDHHSVLVQKIARALNHAGHEDEARLVVVGQHCAEARRMFDLIEQIAKIFSLSIDLGLYENTDDPGMPVLEFQIKVLRPLPKNPELDALEKKLKMDIDGLELSARAYNGLRKCSLDRVGEVVQKRDEELLRVQNLGRKSLSEVKAALDKMGLSTGMDLRQLGIDPETLKRI